MKITVEWLKNELLMDKYYKDYVLDLVSGQKEFDSIRLIKILLSNSSKENLNAESWKDTFNFDILDFANSLLLHSLSNAEIVSYAMYAVKQVFPYLKKDFPGVDFPRYLMAIIELYFNQLMKNEIDPITYKHILSDLVEDANEQINDSMHSNVFWISYATNLVAYASIYFVSKLEKINYKLARVCAMNAVYLAMSYSSINFNRSRILKYIINYGLSMLKISNGSNKFIAIRTLVITDGFLN